MKKKIVVEKYNLRALLYIALHRGRDVHYLDSIEFYPNNSAKTNFIHRVFGKESTPTPLYSKNFSFYSNLLWSSNKEALKFCDKTFEAVLLGCSLGKFTVAETGSPKSILSVKKQILEDISRKIFLKNLEINNSETTVLLEDQNEFGFNTKPRPFFNRFTSFIGSRVQLIALIFFRPFLIRDILRKKICLFPPQTKSFDYGTHLTYGFPTEENQSTLTDSEVFEKVKEGNKKILFVKSIWKTDPENIEQFKKRPKNFEYAIADEFKNRIPLLFLLRFYFKSYLRGFSLLPVVFSNKWDVNFKTYQYCFKSISEYFNSHLFCQYYRVKKFISRDDYASQHITRTIAFNHSGSLNLGIMHSAFSEPHYIPQGAFTYFDTYLVQGKGFKSLWAPYWNDNKNFFSVGQPRDFLVRNEIEGRNAEDRFNAKYKSKITVLMLISAHDKVLSPFFLLKQKHEGIDKLFELSDDIHLILRPRRANAIDSFFAYCPELAPRLESAQISIVTDEFTTQELMSYANILISEDSSSSLLESLPRDDLFAFYFMIRYGEFLPQQNLVVFNAQELVDMVKTYISRPELKAKVLMAKSSLKEQYTTQPAGETWQRIADYLES